MLRKDYRRPRWLSEIKVLHQVAKLRGVFPYTRPGIGPPICLRVNPLATEEKVFDELQVGVEAQGLVVDQALLGIGANNQSRYAKTIAVLVDDRRRDVVVEAAPIV